MFTTLSPRIRVLQAYTPGLSIDEIRQKYGLTRVIKMASNENPLGTSPIVMEAIKRHASDVFRYPRGGNPRLVQALATKYGVDKERIVVGNGSDEIIDLLIRMLAEPGQDAILCCDPCFNLYTVQAAVSGVQVKSCPLKADFSFDFAGLLQKIDSTVRLAFLTTPDNPSGYCPTAEEVLDFAHRLAQLAPNCLLVLDEAYMDFVEDEAHTSLLISGRLPDNVAVLRTFSKSYGLAGLRLGYAVLPPVLADGFWRARLPFSVNILAEEAGLAALSDHLFHQTVLQTVHEGRKFLTEQLRQMGCRVLPSSANFLLFQVASEAGRARACYEALLQRGIIIRHLQSYNLPEYLRVSVGNKEENVLFIDNLRQILA